MLDKPESSLLVLVPAIIACIFGLFASTAHAADLIGTGAGDAALNQTYIDQLDGNWLGENGDYKICTYGGTYAIITAYADVCGSGTQQWYFNFGVTVTSAGIASLAPVNWTNNFFTPPAPQFAEVTPPGPGPDPDAPLVYDMYWLLFTLYIPSLFLVVMGPAFLIGLFIKTIPR